MLKNGGCVERCKSLHVALLSSPSFIGAGKEETVRENRSLDRLVYLDSILLEENL
jgi:hypothetical protein